MIIRNKRGETKSIAPQLWDKLNDLGFAKGWSVISNDEITEARKSIPKELVDFKSIIKEKNGTKGKPAIPGDEAV